MHTENYKQSRILKIFSWVSLIFVVVGEFFKVLHWPGASILLVLGSFVFSCFYLPLFTIELWKYLPNAKLKLLSFMQAIVLFLYAVGFIFKIQHWPGGSLLANINYISLISLVIPFAIYHYSKAAKSSGVKAHSILLVIYFFALTFGSLTNAGSGKVNIDTIKMQGINMEEALKSSISRNNQLYSVVLKEKSDLNNNEVYLKVNKLKMLAEHAFFNVKRLKVQLLIEIENVPKSVADTLSTIELNQPNEIEKTNNILVGDELSINEGTYSAFQLKKSINVFHDSILLLVQDQNRAIIKEGLNLNTKSYDGDDGTPVSWEIANFYRMPLIYVFNELTSIQYEIKNAEYQVLTDIINSSNKEVNTALYSRLITMNAKYDAIKKQEQITKLQSENDKRIEMLNNKDVELNDSQQVITNFVFVTLIFVVLLFFIIRSNYLRLQANKKLKEQKLIIENQKLEVEDKNREILDSIEYAKRIQNTILPPQKIVSQYLENSFILYLPKDIVAGDFYWFAPPSLAKGEEKSSPNSNDNIIKLGSAEKSPLRGSPKLEENEIEGLQVLPLGEDLGGASILFAACDCTGHGVPGAMVSVVCSNALNKAVNEFGLKEPSRILDKVAELVIDDLSKNNEVGDEIQDGMDASLANLNLTTLQLEWAGANNPLWIVRGTEIIEIKANKQPIGKTDYLEPFTNHQIQLQKGDTIYLFTDGYADQFGGEKGKKLSKNNFKELLISIQNKSMNEQREALYESHITWRGTNEQVDDICVIGVRV